MGSFRKIGERTVNRSFQTTPVEFSAGGSEIKTPSGASLRVIDRNAFDSAVRKNYQSRQQTVTPLPTVDTKSTGKTFFEKLGDVLGLAQKSQQSDSLRAMGKLFGNETMEAEGKRIGEEAQRNAQESAKEFQYIAERGVGGVAKGVEGIGNALGYMGQMLGQQQLQQNAQTFKVIGDVTGSENFKGAAQHMSNVVQEQKKQGLQDALSFGTKYQQDVQKRYADADITKTGEVLGGISEGVGGFLPSVAANVVAPGSGIVMTMLSAGGNAAQEALKNGAADHEALAYGAAVGAIEAATEKIFDGVAGVFGKGAADDVIDSIAKRLAKTPGTQNAVKKLADGLGEGFEEFISEFGQRVANELIIDTDNRSFVQTLGDAGVSFLMGAAVSGVIQAAGGISSGMRGDPKVLAQNAADAAVAQVRTQNPSGGVQTGVGAENGAQSKINAPVGTGTQVQEIEPLLTVERKAAQPPPSADFALLSGSELGVAQEIIEQAQRLSEATGRKIQFYRGENPNENGYYDRDSGKIMVNAKSSSPVAQIISHELTHSVEFAEAYRELAALAEIRIAKQGMVFADEVQAKKEQYAKWGKQLDDESAAQEVVADYIAKNLLTDEASIVEMAQNNPTLAQKIRDFLNNLLAALQKKVGMSGTGAQEYTELRRMVETYNRALHQATSGYGVSTDTAMQRMSDAYGGGELTESEFDDALDAVLEDESAAGKSMLEGALLSERASGGVVQYSIEQLPDGKKYVRADRQVIFGNDPESWGEQVEDYINGKIRRGEDVQLITDDGDVLMLTADTAGKAKHAFKPDGSRMSDGEYETKINAETHIDELARVSTRGPTKTDVGNRHGEFASKGWNYRTAYFKDFDGKYYRLQISVAQSEDGNVVYNVGDIKERSFPTVDGSSAKNGALSGKTSFEDKIAENEKEVKTANYGMQNNQPRSYSGAPSVELPRATMAETKHVQADNLPAKAANYLKRAENAMLRTLGEKINVSNPVMNQELKTAVRQVSEEYLSTGQISKETENALFEQVWQQGEGGTERGQSDPEYKRWARNDFDDAMANLRMELRQVDRFANDKADKLAREENTELTLADVKKLYPQLKDARRAYEKVQAKTLLTEADEKMLNEVMRGAADLENLDPEEYNVQGIRAMYEVKRKYEDLAAQIRKWNQARKAELRRRADTFLGTANAWKDKAKGILYSINTMERNVRDIVPDGILADQIVSEYFTPVHRAVAEANNTKNGYRDRVKALNLSREISKADAEAGKVSEAHAVQLLGEAEDNIRMLKRAKGRMKERDGKKLEDWYAVVDNLWENNPQLDRKKIENAVAEFRKIYDELFEQMNDARIRNGYEPINYRSGYFPHFQPGDGDGVMAQFGKALGIETAVSALPTSINGLTHTFKPGITWMGNAQERLGFNTVYDAVEGFDKYIEGVADVIYLTDSIQNLRAFASQVRYRTTDDGIREQIDKIRSDERLTAKEKEDMIERIHNDPNIRYKLGNFAVELDEYINLLANKKSRADRNMEQAMGRDAYNAVKALESRVAANMVAVNPASWLTNFIPLTQGWSAVSTKHMLQGMYGTLKNIKSPDGITGESAFLTNRKGSDPLVRTLAQKTSETLSRPMEWIDTFVASSLVRARYQENLAHGMSEAAAMEDADGWVAGVMADRSKGSTPTVFNRSNPLTKVFTQFQLEVNNQLGYVFKDLPRDMKEKGLAALAGALFKFAIGAFLYNEIYEYFIGRRPALDPIGILNDTVGDITGYELPNAVEALTGKNRSFETEKVGVGEGLENAAGQVVESLPFIGGVMGGGRVPISSALPDVGTFWKAVSNEELAPRKRVREGLEELAKPLTYLAPPFAGGALKKLTQGAEAVYRGGSYSVDNEGREKLQYPVGNDPASVIGATLFGKTTTEGGREWIESGFKTLSADETDVYKTMREAGVDESDAFEILKEMKAQEKKEDKLDVVINSGMSDDLMREMAGLVMGTELKTESGNDSAWAKLLKAVDAGLNIEDAIQMRIDGVDFDKFLEFEAAGIRAKDARKLAESIGKLKPPKGKDSVSNLQRFRAAVNTLSGAENQIDALGTMMSESEFGKLKTANEYGVSPETYIDFKETLPRYDVDSSGSYSQEEAKAAIDAMGIRDNEWKAVLWQMANTGWKAKSNPYSQRVGQQIYDAMH